MHPAFLVAALAAAAPSAASPPRDAILITIDTWRADAAGFSGSKKVATPVLDCLAAAGRVFDARSRPRGHHPSLARLDADRPLEWSEA